MQQKKKNIFKTILIGTAIVSIIPPAYESLKFYFLNPNDFNFLEACSDFLISSLFSIIVTCSIFISNFLIIGKFTRALEGKVNHFVRIGICTTSVLLIANLIIYIEWYLFNIFLFHKTGIENREQIFANQILASVIVIIVSLTFEIKHFIDRLKIVLAEKEKLEKKHLKSQLESLRSQINPHFLFNSFSALQSLIDSDTEKAKAFLLELSKVYRYVLEHKDAYVVSMQDEMRFLHSFIYLNKIRFGENLIFTTNLDSTVMQKYIPPLTLQLLVENAIKHNVITTQNPLTIEVYNEGQHLIVRNNVQLRTEKIISTGMGLENLKERYQLIHHSNPQFILSETYYTAMIPLIDNEP